MNQSNVLRFVHVRSPRRAALHPPPVLGPDDEDDQAIADELRQAGAQAGSAEAAARHVASRARAAHGYSVTAHRGVLSRSHAVDQALAGATAEEIRQGLDGALGQDRHALVSSEKRIRRDLQAVQLAPEDAAELRALVWLARLVRVLVRWDDDAALRQAAETFDEPKPVLGPATTQALVEIASRRKDDGGASHATSRVAELAARRRALEEQLSALRARHGERVRLLRRLEDATADLFAAETGATPSEALGKKTAETEPDLDLMAARLAAARDRAARELGISSPAALGGRHLDAGDLKAIPLLRESAAEGMTFEAAQDLILRKLTATTRELAAAARRAKEGR